MIALLQRVTHACVSVDGIDIARIQTGLLVLVGVQRGDTEAQAQRLLTRLLAYRMFTDAAGKMNLGLSQQQGLLLVPQFTLAADTRHGNRPGFSTAASPALGESLFNYLVSQARQLHPQVVSGRFGANMQVTLCNDGPVTFWLQVDPDPASDA